MSRAGGAANSSAFLTVLTEHVSIRGVGAVDAAAGPGNILLADGARDLAVRDVFFKNCTDWALRLRRSRNITLDRAKVFSGVDGIDVDASADVLVDNAFVRSPRGYAADGSRLRRGWAVDIPRRHVAATPLVPRG